MKGQGLVKGHGQQASQAAETTGMKRHQDQVVDLEAMVGTVAGRATM
jgi:hypothetical protein